MSTMGLVAVFRKLMEVKMEREAYKTAFIQTVMENRGKSVEEINAMIDELDRSIDLRKCQRTALNELRSELIKDRKAS